MTIRLADIKDVESVWGITHETIKTIYPRYYPQGAVAFFLAYHNRDQIALDIENKRIYLLIEEHKPIGTVSIKENEVSRLFILPEAQSKGLGSCLLMYAENLIRQDYSKTRIDASLPGKAFYLKHGYQEISYQKIQTENGDYLCFDVMEKSEGKETK